MTAETIDRAHRRCQRRGLPRGDRPVPARAAGALLPDARLGARGRGPGAGDLPAGLALLPRLRGPVLAAHLALPDRHQRLPHRAGQPQAAPDADRPGRAELRTPTTRWSSWARCSGSSRCPTRCWSGGAATRRPGHHRGRPGQRPAGADRRPAAAAAAAAGGAGAARGAPAARRRGRRDARHVGGRGQQQPAAGPGPARGGRADRGGRGRARRPPRSASCWTATPGPSRPRTWRPSWRSSPPTSSGRCRPSAPGSRAPTPSRGSSRPTARPRRASCGCCPPRRTASRRTPCTGSPTRAGCRSSCRCWPLTDGRMSHVTAFFDLSLFPTFGLPARLDEDAALGVAVA